MPTFTDIDVRTQYFQYAYKWSSHVGFLG